MNFINSSIINIYASTLSGITQSISINSRIFIIDQPIDLHLLISIHLSTPLLINHNLITEINKLKPSNSFKDFINSFLGLNIEKVYFNFSEGLLNTPPLLKKLLNNTLTPNLDSKKQNGEVFTPPELIEKMFDTLPESVWSNPSLKWYDPAAGIGHFSLILYQRLFNGLQEVISDQEERKRHILEHMIFMSEINEVNVKIAKFIFDPNDEYNLNLKCEDSLETSFTQQFDIIIGNPPYQESNKSGDNKLYLKFTQKAIEMLKEDGYLLFITPRNILGYLLCEEKNRAFVSEFYKIEYLAIETVKKYFPTIGSTFVYFLLKKMEYDGVTKIEYMEEGENRVREKRLMSGMRIPMIYSERDERILEKVTTEEEKERIPMLQFKFGVRGQRIRKEHLKKKVVMEEETRTHKYKIVDTMNKSHPFPGRYYYYIRGDNDIQVDKLVVSKKGYLYPVVDRTHEYTYSDNFMYITEGNLEGLKRILESSLMRYLLKQYSMNGFDGVSVMERMRRVDFEGEEDEVYDRYGLTEEEKEYIKKY